MKNINVYKRITFCSIIGGIVLAGLAGLIWGVEPLHPVFIVGGIIAFGGIVFGIITVRCPFCHRQLDLRGWSVERFCPYCGEKF